MDDTLEWENVKVKCCCIDKSHCDGKCRKSKSFHVAFLYNSRVSRRKYPLKLLLTANKREDKFSLSISGNIRKWYRQKNSKKDLKYDEFIDCIRIIAKGIQVEEDVLLKMEITKLVAGTSLLLKSEKRDLNNSLIKNGTVEKEYFKKIYFLRFDLSTNQIKASTFIDKFDTLKKVRDNWNHIPLIIETHLTDVVFADVISKNKKPKLMVIQL
ncbi:MAG TPA: hypothetical protein VIV55_00855 [Flavobacterium sp.]